MEDSKLNELVIVEQLPIIKQKLQIISDEVDKEIEYALSLEVNDESVKEVKNARARLNKIKIEMEERRKQVKNAVLNPYNEFETIYNELVKDKLSSADSQLKEKIDNVENQLKLEKEEELKEFFKQHCIAKGIDGWFNFESFNYPITLSASMKSLKEKILEDLNNIEQALKLISMEEFGDEILLEFKKNRDFSKSKIDVITRHKQLEELQQKQKEVQLQIDEENKVIEKVEEITTPKEIIEDDELLTVTFTITDTKEKIIKVREFMKEEGINYD